MIEFHSLFGVEKPSIKETCLLSPFLRKDTLKYFGLDNVHTGKLYLTASNELFTLIKTGIGSALLGDAVLYLGKTACRNVILFGSCGSIQGSKNIAIGTLVSPSQSYSLESFTDMLSGQNENWTPAYPDKELFGTFMRFGRPLKVKDVSCATVGSLKLELEYLARLKRERVQVTDMECSAFFAAAKNVGLKAMAVMYVSDIIRQKPFYSKLSKEDSSTLEASIRSAIHILCEFIKTHLPRK